MKHRDEFDDSEGFYSAFGKIAGAMEQGRSGLRQRGPMLGLLTVAVALFVLFAVFWSTYPRADAERGDGPVPLVRADATPFKVTPEEPGGMDIPYRDSTVFETLRGAQRDDDRAPVESLLPAPEEPIARDKMFAGLKTDPIVAPVEPAGAPALDAGPVQVAPADRVAESDDGAILAQKTDGAVPPPPAAKPAQQDKAPEIVAKTEPAAGAGSGTHFIQLGSVKDRAAATAEWDKVKKQFPDELGGLAVRIQDVTLPDRGTFYRIQGGAVSQSRAREICSTIAARRPGGCLVVAR